ncbi:MAG TPA: TolC family protein [Candidatus Acidoferrum sp.]|nr:TolC family protein [Candidatus Acidoferrum sp.]
MPRFCLALLWGGLACGCAHFEPKPVSPAQTASALEGRTLEDPGLRSFLEKNLPRAAAGGLPRAWDMEMFTLAAFYYHPDLEVARAEWAVAQAAIQTAGGRPNPTLSVDPAYNFSHVNAQYGLTPWLPTVSLDVPLETAGKRGHRIAQARQLSESARLNIAATAWQVRGKVRQALLDLSAARQREALLQDQISIQRQILALLDQQIQAGALAGVEAVAFRIALQKTQLDVADAQRDAADARAHLAESIGVPVRALDAVELAMDFPDNPGAANLTSDEIRNEAMLGRADVLAALADYAAAQSALQLEIAKQYPDVHIGPAYQFDQGDNMWTLGLSAELPVLNRNQGPIAEAAARRAESAARFSALQAKVLAEIDGAVESFRASEKSLALLQDLAATQARSRDAIAGQVSAGAAAPLDLLNARLEFAVAEEGRLEARVKRQQALAALENAVQRPIELITPGVVERSPAETKEKRP